MIEFGKTLRSAREAKGLTARQIADATHMMTQVVDGLENENFSKIAAPIYGRGFVKLYCEAVGLDPKPMIEEFMAIINGNRETIRPEPPPAAEPPPIAEPPAEPPPAAKPRPEPPPAVEPPPDIMPEPSPPPVADSPVMRFEQPPAANHSPSRYAAPIPLDDAEISPRRGFSIPRLPPNAWRIAVVTAAAVLIFWGIVAGVRFVYRATMTAPETVMPDAEEETPAPETAAKPETAAPASRVERVALPARPFYVD